MISSLELQSVEFHFCKSRKLFLFFLIYLPFFFKFIIFNFMPAAVLMYLNLKLLECENCVILVFIVHNLI